MRISDWSSDVFSSDLLDRLAHPGQLAGHRLSPPCVDRAAADLMAFTGRAHATFRTKCIPQRGQLLLHRPTATARHSANDLNPTTHTTTHMSRSEEHTSELQSLLRISYAVFFLKKQTQT